jgi:hypothetical protein
MGSREKRTRLYTRQRFLFLLLLLAKLRQKEKLKLFKHSKIKWFWRFSIARFLHLVFSS